MPAAFDSTVRDEAGVPLTTTDATSIGMAQLNQLASSQIMVARLNGNLKSIYLTGYNNWKLSVDAGRLPNTNPPVPPKAYVVSAKDAAGFQWPELGTEPVCPMPALPEDHFTPRPKAPPNTIDVGHNIGGHWFSVGPDDTCAPGTITPPVLDPQGVPHTYEKYAAPVGAGWYLQLT